MVDKYTLNWNTFTDHLQLMFKDLYEQDKYSDVTLVCDDQTQFKAHKIVLSACSPVFKKIIDSNPSQQEKETEEDIRPKHTSEKIRQRQPRSQISSDAKSTECHFSIRFL